MFTGSDAQAVPAFARQTGMPCNACHFQNFPALNAMGRSFKNGGYVMEGAQASIEGENQLKLPDTLNIGAIIKIRHNKGSGDYTKTHAETDYGRVDFPDEAALLIGGRVSANAGALWEFSTKDGETAAVKYVFLAAQAGDIQFEVIPYSGPAATYGFMPFNTAALGLQRFAESKVGSAANKIGFEHEATGIDFVATAPNWFVTYNAFGPASALGSGGEFAGNIGGMANYISVGYFMDLAGFDTGFGYGMYGGTMSTMETTTTVAVDGTETSHSAEIKLGPAGSHLDIQLQGELAGMATGFYITQASVPAGSATATAANPYAAGIDSKGNYNAKSATGIAAKVSVMPELAVAFQSGSLDPGAGIGSESMTDISAQYMISQNVKFEYHIETVGETNATNDGYDAYTLNQMMLFAAF
jgi:hypothetical protein